MAPTLYYMPEGATSRAALFLIRYLKMDVQLKTVRTYMNEHMDPTFLKLNPTHTVPILDDNGFVLINSHAIGMYLVEQYGSKTNLFGTTIKERALIIQRLFFNEMLFTEMRIMLKPIIAGESTKYEEKILHHIFEMLAFLEGFLKTQDFVAGKYVTLADFYLVNIILTLMNLNFDLTQFKHIHDWVMRMKVLTGFTECEQGAMSLAKLVLPKLK